MEDFVLIGKLQRIISQRHEDIVTAMASGMLTMENINIC